MSRLQVFGLFALGLVILGMGGVISFLWSEVKESQKSQAKLEVVAQSQETALSELKDGAKRDAEIVEKKLSQDQDLTSAVRRLESKLQGALNNAKSQSFTLDSVLPRDAITALCVQWYKASGYSASTHAGASAGAAYARAPHTTAAGRISSGATSTEWDCSGWQGLTLRAAVEWAGLLLTHAGHERLDKAALREWAQKARVE